MKRVVAIVAGTMLSVGLLTSPASASILVVGSDNDFFFNNFENLFDSSGHWKAPSSAPVVGDHLAGIINIQNIDVEGTTHFFAGPTSQLTGIFAQRILDISSHGGITHLTLGNPTLTSYCRGADCFSTVGLLSPGEMFALYLQQGGGTTVFESNGTMLDDVSKATDGSLWVTLGINGDAFVYSHPILGVNPEGLAFGGLNVIQNNTGVTTFQGINDPNETEVGGTTVLTDLVVSSEFELNPNGFAGRALAKRPCPTSGCSPWEFRSNDPATVHPAIPEVSSLWLLGLGFGTIGAFGRRKWLG